MKCTKCGAELKPGARFCGRCGNAVTETVSDKIPRREKKESGIFQELRKHSLSMKKTIKALDARKKCIFGVSVLAVLLIVLFFIFRPHKNGIEGYTWKEMEMGGDYIVFEDGVVTRTKYDGRTDLASYSIHGNTIIINGDEYEWRVSDDRLILTYANRLGEGKSISYLRA